MNRIAWAYASPGFAIAFAALPLYLLTPQLYAATLGLPLAAVGLILMATRLVDAVTDPIIGRLIDRTSGARFQKWLAPALLILAFAFICLTMPPTGLIGQHNTGLLLLWLGATALVVSLSNSAAILAHQSWAIAASADTAQQRQWIAGREVLGLAGLILAAGLAAQQETLAMAVILLATTIMSVWAISRVPSDCDKDTVQEFQRPMPLSGSELFHRSFVRLLTALGINALANAIPATLFLFFVGDRLGLSAQWSAGLLVLYFVCAAAAVPFWTRRIAVHGPRRTWQWAMGISIAAFCWAVFLDHGQAVAFGLICVVTGFALGAELTCPSLLVGQLITARGHHGKAEGQYFGYLSLLHKLALAFAAGLTLPLLQYFAYRPGSSPALEQTNGTAATATGSEGLLALQLAYAGIPCLLKLIALMILPASPATAPTPATTRLHSTP
jgi:glycoside/pentoside/hexuronide:cation symporter, GPH family